MNIEEGNKLIAKFMGGELVEFIDLSNSNCTAFKMNNSIYPFYSLAYHSSWDWLMPAIKKFMGIKNLEDKQLGKYNYWCIKIDDAVCSYDLQFTHATLINAIEWYNSEQSVKESDTSKAT